jgi:hypothetical protein
MPPACVHRKASRPAAERLEPTTTEPSRETAVAWLRKMLPGRSPRPTMPLAASKRKAWVPLPEMLLPTMTEPSAETPVASLEKTPPGRSPRPTMPFTASQRNAWMTMEFERLAPTTTRPSADTWAASLWTMPPGRSPRGMKTGSSAETREASSSAALRPNRRSRERRGRTLAPRRLREAPLPLGVVIGAGLRRLK